MVKKQIHLPRPHRIGRSTTHARGASFAQLTTGLGTGRHVAGTLDTGPFHGADAAVWAKRTGNLDTLAQAWVAAAIAIPDIRKKISNNTGTIPELVLAGRYVTRGWKIHRTLFFQETSLRGFRLARAYVADVAVLGPGGTLWLLPIDGVFYHSRTLREQIVTKQQHMALSGIGRVIPVPDTECQSGVRLDNFLRRVGAP